MADRHIICIEPASGRGELVVVQVQQEGTRPLDLHLVGCEGENPYVTTSKTGNLPGLASLIRLQYKSAILQD